MCIQDVPYITIENWLRAYSSWCVECEIMQEKLDSLAQFKVDSAESLYHQAWIEINKQAKSLPLLRARVKMIEKALQALTDEERYFVTERYLNRHTTNEVLQRMQWSHRTFYRRRQQILDQIYQMVGGSEAYVWFPDLRQND